MSNVYLGRLKDGNGDIVYPATQTSVVYDENGINIDDKIRNFLHAEEPIPHIQVGEIDAHTIDGHDLEWILEHGGGGTSIPSTTNLLKGDGNGGAAAAVAGTDYVTPSALNGKADVASPTFTGTPKAPTASAGTNTQQIATTAFVTTAITNAITNAIVNAIDASY